MRPPFALEHLDIGGIERIVFDRLQMHRDESPFTGFLGLGLCQQIQRVIYGWNHSRSGASGPSSSRLCAQAASLELAAAAPISRRASAALIGWPKM